MLGGEIIAERGLGDDQDLMGYRNEYNVWVEGFVAALQAGKNVKKEENATFLFNSTNIETTLMVVKNIETLYEEAERTTYYV